MTRPNRSTRLIDTLMAEKAAGQLSYDGVDAGVFHVEIAGLRRVYDTDRMSAWLDGYLDTRDAGRPAPQPVHPHLTDVWRLLAFPIPVDARRLQVLTAMEARGLSIRDAAALIGRRRESVRWALRFGRPLVRTEHTPSLVALEQELEADLEAIYGPQWSQPQTLSEGAPQAQAVTLLGCSQTGPEPVAFRRARCLLHAHAAGYLLWADPVHPDQVRRATVYLVERGGSEMSVRDRHVVPWLQGLADGAGDTTLAGLLTDTRNHLHHVDDLIRVG